MALAFSVRPVLRQYPWCLRLTDGSWDRFDDRMRQWGQSPPPFLLLLLSVPQTPVPFRLGLLSSHILLLLDFLSCDRPASPHFPILYPSPATPPPCLSNAWPNATPWVGFSVYYPSQISFLSPLHSRPNRPGFHSQVALVAELPLAVGICRLLEWEFFEGEPSVWFFLALSVQSHWKVVAV